MSSQCKLQMDSGILDIGTRCAVYGSVVLTILLGGVSIFKVKRQQLQGQPSPEDNTNTLTEDEEKINTNTITEDEEKFIHKRIRKHKRSFRPIATTLNLTGIVMVGAAFIILQSHKNKNQIEAQANNSGLSSDNTQGPFTLFHAYTLLSLLWLIALAGFMIHVHTWVWNGTHWYLLQIEALGVYGYYVCTHRNDFPTPPCPMSIFDNDRFRTFAKVVYIIAMIPVVNVCLFGAPLFGLVWIVSQLASRTRRAKNEMLYFFNFFWILCCGSIGIIVIATTEVLLFTHTSGQTLWTFGSLLAFALLVIPVEAFIFELYWLAVPDANRQGVKQN
ncbi:hypothetical protein FRC12_014592 [Ceratobasidium sp. 428]|nr:hypothetical protein FRC12_014592 [Ceratobasidium sp. 428]